MACPWGLIHQGGSCLLSRMMRKDVGLFQDGRPDTSFFAPDCINPGQKFHSQLSRALWVNMVRQVGCCWGFNLEPSMNPYIYTQDR